MSAVVKYNKGNQYQYVDHYCTITDWRLQEGGGGGGLYNKIILGTNYFTVRDNAF